MAVRDVREYYWQTQCQYLEMKQTLDEAKEAIAAGQITEDQLTNALDIMSDIEDNYNRLSYVMYLLEKPNKKKKKAGYDRANRKLLAEMQSRHATEDDALADGKSALDKLREELKRLTSE